MGFSAAVLPILKTVGTALSVASTVSSFFGGRDEPDVPALPPPPPPPTLNVPEEVEEDRQEQVAPEIVQEDAAEKARSIRRRREAATRRGLTQLDKGETRAPTLLGE